MDTFLINIDTYLLLQEAKEDAEMDAEIALEMAMERERKLSAASNNSSLGGTYIGPCPHSPGQVGRTLLINQSGNWEKVGCMWCLLLNSYFCLINSL